MMKYVLHHRQIEEWDVSSVDDMSYVFNGKGTCNPNIGNWDVGGVTDFVSAMFDRALETFWYDCILLSIPTILNGYDE